MEVDKAKRRSIHCDTLAFCLNDIIHISIVPEHKTAITAPIINTNYVVHSHGEVYDYGPISVIRITLYRVTK